MIMRTPTQSPFWERAKILIRVHKVSQKNFAEHVGVSYGTLKDWICYGVIPDAGTAYDIAVALGVTVEYLVNGTHEQAMREHEKETLKRKTVAAKLRKIAAQIDKHAALIG